jgi:hypothetical protein
MTDNTEPTFDVTERPCLILEMPELPDEAALELCEFLYSLAERFEDHYSAQCLRAHRARECERARLYREQRFSHAQQPLPLDDPPF